MTSTPATPSPLLTPANFSYSPSFASLLTGLGSSLLATTYQAGQLVSLGTHGGELQVALEPFSVAMGIATHPRRLAIGDWFARPDLDDGKWRTGVGSIVVTGGQV